MHQPRPSYQSFSWAHKEAHYNIEKTHYVAPFSFPHLLSPFICDFVCVLITWRPILVFHLTNMRNLCEHKSTHINKKCKQILLPFLFFVFRQPPPFQATSHYGYELLQAATFECSYSHLSKLHHETIVIIYLFKKFHLFASPHICIFFMHVKTLLFINSINFNMMFHCQFCCQVANCSFCCHV